MEPFTIRRAAVKRLKDPSLLAFFDAAARRAGTEDLSYENGFEPRTILNASPRALWLLAKAGLIPLTEKEALHAILREGRSIENPRPPVARVQRFKIEDSVFMMRHFARRNMAAPFKGPVPARVIKL
jgi:hypothetical protein